MKPIGFLIYSREVRGEDLYLMQMEMLEEDEIEPYRNPVVMKSAGYRLWQACFLACLDEGLSPIKAEELCNSKFIRKSDPAMMIPSLKEAMRPLIKQYLSLHRPRWQILSRSLFRSPRRRSHR